MKKERNMIDINENLENWEFPHYIMTSHSLISPEWAFAVDVWVNNQLPLLTCFKTIILFAVKDFYHMDEQKTHHTGGSFFNNYSRYTDL